MFPYVLFKSGFHVMEAGTVGIMNLLVLGVVHTGIGYCLYFSSLGDLKGQEAAILSYIDPLVACAMSVFVMGEAMGLMQAAGGVMILGFTLYNELGGKHRHIRGKRLAVNSAGIQYVIKTVTDKFLIDKYEKYGKLILVIIIDFGAYIILGGVNEPFTNERTSPH